MPARDKTEPSGGCRLHNTEERLTSGDWTLADSYPKHSSRERVFGIRVQPKRSIQGGCCDRTLHASETIVRSPVTQWIRLLTCLQDARPSFYRLSSLVSTDSGRIFKRARSTSCWQIVTAASRICKIDDGENRMFGRFESIIKEKRWRSFNLRREILGRRCFTFLKLSDTNR